MAKKSKKKSQKPVKKAKKVAKVVKTVKAPRLPRIKKNTQEKIDPKLKKLITKGKRRGYLTQKEILEFYPDAENNLEELDSLYEKLLEVGVDVYDVESEK